MKKLPLIILSIFLLVGIVYAKGVYYYAGETVSGAVSYIHDIPCDDNAANTTVTNDGTKANWTSGDSKNTDTYGDGSKFDMEQSKVNFYLADWDEEKFEIIWKVYINDATATANNGELWFQVGDGDHLVENNEIILWRTNGSDELKVYCKAGDTEKARETTDWNPSVSTWYWLKLTVDASGTTWTIALSSSTDGSSYTGLTFEAGDWNVGTAASWDNNTGYFGDSSSSDLYKFEGYFDAITVEDKS